MKTSTFKYFGLALVAILMVSFTSREMEVGSLYDDDSSGTGHYNRSTGLYSRIWISFYRDMDGNYCRQELDFLLDRTRIDYIQVEHPNGTVEQYEYNFRWSWENCVQTSTRVSYGPNGVSYPDDIYIGGNRLSDYPNGRNDFVEFQRR